MLKQEMTHKERILAAINHRQADRIPLDYWGVPEITEKLMQHFGVKTFPEFADALDIDMVMTVEPRLIAERINTWNIRMKKVPIGHGAYYEEPEALPLAGYEDIGEIEKNYVFPDADMFDYNIIREQCRAYEGFAITGGYISLTYFYEMIRGTEQMLIDLIAFPEIAEYIFAKLQNFAYNQTKRILEAGEGKIHLSQVTDDFGTQNSLISSPGMLDRYLGKYYDKNIALVQSFGAKVFHHDDGAMTPMLPWLANKGIDVLNPLQWHLPGWDLPRIKAEYGEKICFHGGVDNQQVLPFGSKQDVINEVEACMNALYRDKTGYILGPCHNVQSITPIENIITMYEHAKKYSQCV
jgi:uroporphyrinogen decarboxylase